MAALCLRKDIRSVCLFHTHTSDHPCSVHTAGTTAAVGERYHHILWPPHSTVFQLFERVVASYIKRLLRPGANPSLLEDHAGLCCFRALPPPTRADRELTPDYIEHVQFEAGQPIVFSEPGSFTLVPPPRPDRELARGGNALSPTALEGESAYVLGEVTTDHAKLAAKVQQVARALRQLLGLLPLPLLDPSPKHGVPHSPPLAAPPSSLSALPLTSSPSAPVPLSERVAFVFVALPLIRRSKRQWRMLGGEEIRRYGEEFLLYAREAGLGNYINGDRCFIFFFPHDPE